MGWGSAQSLRERGSHVQMRVQPEIERNPASRKAISASRFLDLTGFRGLRGSNSPTTSGSRPCTDCPSSLFRSLRSTARPLRQRLPWPSRPQSPRTPSASRSRTILLYSTASSCLQLNCKYKRLTRPLCSSRITSLHRSYESVRPSARHRYSRLVVSATCASPFASENWFPQFRTRAQIRFTPPARRSPPIQYPGVR